MIPPSSPRSRALRLVILLSLALVVRFTASLHAAEPPNFEKEILPILRTHCAECHDERKQKAGFRVDVRSAALRGGESGKTAIIPKKSGSSELIRRIETTDEDAMMPPKGKRLSANEVKTLKAWIDAGADWPDAFAGTDDAKRRHWAFQAPVRPALP